MLPKLIIISQFYNEEFLLPYWIEHYSHIADHVVFIDYASTDNSLKIIEEMSPGWTVLPSKLDVFDAHLNELQIMDVEKQFPGDWKLSVNTTEFLVFPQFSMFKDSAFRAIKLPNYVMVESEETFNTSLIENYPLIFQRTHGYLDTPYRQRGGPRFIHRGTPDEYGPGQRVYPLGRDTMDIHPIVEPEFAFLAWWGWSPFPQSIPRKLQIQKRVPESDLKKGYGHQHFGPGDIELKEEHLLERLQSERSRSGNLLQDNNFKEALLLWNEFIK